MAHLVLFSQTDTIRQSVVLLLKHENMAFKCLQLVLAECLFASVHQLYCFDLLLELGNLETVLA